MTDCEAIHKFAIPSVFVGVAMCNLRAAADRKDARAVWKERHRLQRMLRRYAVHPDVAAYAELHLKATDG